MTTGLWFPLWATTAHRQHSSLTVGIRFLCCSYPRAAEGMGRRHLQRLPVPKAPPVISNPSILWGYYWRMHYDWRNVAHRGYCRVMPTNGPKSIAEVDFASLVRRQYTPSPDCWADQILYFLMLD